MSRLLIVLMTLACSSCAWVKPTEAGAQVELITPAEAKNCTKKGATTSKTLGSIVFVPRNEAKIASELVTLAKNEAVIMGGDSVAPGAKPSRGEREFLIYLCR